jgi:hypothetical protein
MLVFASGQGVYLYLFLFNEQINKQATIKKKREKKEKKKKKEEKGAQTKQNKTSQPTNNNYKRETKSDDCIPPSSIGSENPGIVNIRKTYLTPLKMFRFCLAYKKTSTLLNSNAQLSSCCSLAMFSTIFASVSK